MGQILDSGRGKSGEAGGKATQQGYRDLILRLGAKGFVPGAQHGEILSLS
jgi:hypothetical protein